MPNELYRQVDIAKIDLAYLHLGLVVKVSLKTTLAYKPGFVIGQFPKAGAAVGQGSTVRLTVSEPPACLPSYPTICLKPYQPVRCREIPYRDFPVLPPDPYGLDANHDGIGCPRHVGH